MDMRKVLGLAGLGLAVGLVGCGSDGNGASRDASADDAGGEFDNLPQLIVAEAPADFDCERSEPEGGADVTFTLKIRDFQTNVEVPGTCVNVYPDNVVPTSDTCGGVMTDANGDVEVTAPAGGWFAYRLFPVAGSTMGVVQRNVVAASEAGATVTGNSVSETTASLLPGLLGRQRLGGAAIFAGAVYDCSNRTVEGAAFRVVRNNAALPAGPGATDPMYAYFSSASLPDVNQRYTNTNGLFLAINMPIGTPGEMVQLVSCGRKDGTTVSRLGVEETRSFADTVNIVSLYPERTDGPDPDYHCN
jgi:hypothetical protein